MPSKSPDTGIRNSDGPTIAADPSGVARRIEAISDIVQVLGLFERYPSPEGASDERLRYTFSPVQSEATPVSDTEFAVFMEFAFVVKAVTPTTDASMATAPPEGPEAPAAEAPPPDLRAMVRAAFLVRYRLKPGPEIPPAEIAKFAEVNSPLNIVPYWREFLHTSLRRAGLPPVLAPVHKLEPQT